MTEITPIYFYPEYSRTPDAALLREAIRFSQWSVGASNDQHYYVEVFEPGLPGVVPVGTVENIHGHIERYTGKKPPPPMNVPKCLRKFAAPGIRDIEGPVTEGLLGEFFAKSNDVIKHPNNGPNMSLPAGNWEIKGLREYEAEYRLFYWRGRWAGAQIYLGSLVRQSVDLEKTVESIRNALEQVGDVLPPALTVDIGIVDGPKNEPPREGDVIECHHFYACGLYGMDAPAHLLMMTSGWWKWFLREGEERGNDTTNE